MIGLLLTYITLVQWKIAVVVIAIIAIGVIAKCTSNATRILAAILFLIMAIFVIYTGTKYKKDNLSSNDNSYVDANLESDQLNDNAETEEETVATGDSNQSKSVRNVGDVISFGDEEGNPDYSITITDWGTSEREGYYDETTGSVLTWFKYEVENIGDEDTVFSDTIFTVYADDYAIDRDWTADGQKALETIAPGKKVSGRFCVDIDAGDVEKLEIQIHDCIVDLKGE